MHAASFTHTHTCSLGDPCSLLVLILIGCRTKGSLEGTNVSSESLLSESAATAVVDRRERSSVSYWLLTGRPDTVHECVCVCVCVCVHTCMFPHKHVCVYMYVYNM